MPIHTKALRVPDAINISYDENMFRLYGEDGWYKLRNGTAALLFVKKDGEWYLLFNERSSKISEPGVTCFPGGKIDNGESSEKGARREVLEELDIEGDKLHRLNMTLPMGVSCRGFTIDCIPFILADENEAKLAEKGKVGMTLYEEEVANAFLAPIKFFYEKQKDTFTKNVVVERGEEKIGGIRPFLVNQFYYKGLDVNGKHGEWIISGPTEKTVEDIIERYPTVDALTSMLDTELNKITAAPSQTSATNNLVQVTVSNKIYNVDYRLL